MPVDLRNIGRITPDGTGTISIPGTVSITGDANVSNCYQAGGVAFACNQLGQGVNLSRILSIAGDTTAGATITNVDTINGLPVGPNGSDMQVQYNNNAAFGAADMYWDNTIQALGIRMQPEVRFPAPVSNVDPNVSLDMHGSININWESPPPPAGPYVNFRGYCLDGYGCLGTLDGNVRQLYNIHVINGLANGKLTLECQGEWEGRHGGKAIDYYWDHTAEVYYYGGVAWSAQALSMHGTDEISAVQVTQGSQQLGPGDPGYNPNAPPWQPDLVVKTLFVGASYFGGGYTRTGYTTDHWIRTVVDNTEMMTFTPDHFVGLRLQTPTHLLELGLDDAVKPGGGSWSMPSDMRTKRNVRKFDGGMDVIRKVEPIVGEYNGKAGTPEGTRVVSFDPEKLREICPGAVSSARKKIDDQETDVLCVNMHELIMNMLCGLQQIDTRLSKLEEKV
ncbi:MAG: hypothetical protein C5B60_09180 [Chloroflexi bacterium]|nr:MAG: hypothetical protein C5B60_09180 [Chloroflexota bacterium]